MSLSGAIDLRSDIEKEIKVNGQRVNHYLGEPARVLVSIRLGE